MRKNLLTLLLLPLLSYTYVYAQQDNNMKTAYLSDGTAINAYVEKQPDGTYKLTIEDGSVFFFQENEISFNRTDRISQTSTPGSSEHNGHEYVDLGLSVKWATCNIGAENPGMHGNYFMWGDYAVNSNCSWSTYLYCAGSGKNQTKYSTKKKTGYKGFVDNISELEQGDDVAHVIWGGEWRMPTIYEMKELQSRCSWNWERLNGVSGYKVTSRVPGYEGRYIFLPASGSCSEDKINGVGNEGSYWSNTLEVDDPENAHVLKFNIGNINLEWTDERCDGHTVRAVLR